MMSVPFNNQHLKHLALLALLRGAVEADGRQAMDKGTRQKQEACKRVKMMAAVLLAPKKKMLQTSNLNLKESDV